ncbi:hypothetical protein AB6A40_008361 [Gnathostoma spinigerum]|uniref:Uncharacterized protein n=1 Tax=Gnathostoma spinigerum TaxID=75299 RepID=A0ABD6EYH1_9BILA
MERPSHSTSSNHHNILVFWGLAVAVFLTIIAGVLHSFHLFNNQWLFQTDTIYEYQRGLGDDCVKSDKFTKGIKCSKWNDPNGTFVANGDNVAVNDVLPVSTGMKMIRILYIINIFLYVIVVFLISCVCVKKRDLIAQRILCLVSLILALSNVIIILVVIVNSFSPFIYKKGEASLGSAFYFFMFSNLLFWLGCISHFHTWKDVYAELPSRPTVNLRLLSRPATDHHNMDERRPSWLSV